jgi:HEAT repeat protein
MKCEEVDKLMIDYLDKNLDDQLTRDIEKHLETCERCLDELKDNQRVLNLISSDELVKPDDSVRINFYHMLHSEIKKAGGESVPKLLKMPWYNRSSYRAAAAVALLIAGTFIGMFLRGRITNQYQADEFNQLKSEVAELKKTAMLTMLKDGSSSDRLQAVSYVDDLGQADESVIDVLVKTLNYDKNVNVRMSAAYALAKFSGQKAVMDSLVHSLSIQTDPILQVTLINILAEKKEKSALKPIQQIISNKSTMKEVRAVAQNSLRVLI